MLDYITNNWLGTLALIMASAFVFAGLPAQIVRVWQLKSAEGVSFFFVFSYLVQSIVWVLYGIQKKDWAIGFPNVFAAIFTAILLVEWIMFRQKEVLLVQK